ncbi:cytochrome b5-like [Lingula anatina]|uniref:Cytochrome b5-like n=1 Tax=Lingula anatina TaxID=7574 RepID=A0A1S3JAH3_LINAN|nr:cytochrome b5-like [Lingula anatina]|eukprot:XP_013407405.1 cytochrome b5-like [Lingula anatina]
MSESQNLKVYRAAEVREQSENGKTWLIIYNKVYDVTEFKYEHPGGEHILNQYSGDDASSIFVYINHSEFALNLMNKYLIGVLHEDDRDNRGEK